MTIEIVDVPINSMVIFHSYVTVYHSVSHSWWRKKWFLSHSVGSQWISHFQAQQRSPIPPGLWSLGPRWWFWLVQSQQTHKYWLVVYLLVELYGRVIYHYILVGGFNLPLSKMMEWKSVGMMTFPIWWESHKNPWFQTTNQYTQYMLKYSNIIILDQQHETSMSDFWIFVGSSECDLKIWMPSLWICERTHAFSDGPHSSSAERADNVRGKSAYHQLSKRTGKSGKSRQPAVFQGVPIPKKKTPRMPWEKICRMMNHGSLNVPIEHHPTIRFHWVYGLFYGYYFWWCPIYPKIGQLPTLVWFPISKAFHKNLAEGRLKLPAGPAIGKRTAALDGDSTR